MKFRAEDLADRKTPYDVCIVGSGPAGFTLALELRNSGLTVCLLESGGEVLSPALDDLKALESAGLVIKPESRERVIGGASQTWSGFVAPLDPIDFDKRDGLHDGWPVPAQEIEAYLDARGHRYMIPRGEAFQYHRHAAADHALPGFEGLVPKVFHTQTRPLRYGKSFAYALAADGFDLYSHATVLRMENTAGTVEAAIVADSAGNEHRVQARIFVLAASAIETVRILFNSQLGNERDQLGRYFMNHPKGNVGKVVFSAPLPPGHALFETAYQAFSGYVGLRLSEDVQRSEGLLNSYIRFETLKDEADYDRAKQLSRSLRSALRAARRGDIGEFGTQAGTFFKSLSGVKELIVRARNRRRSRSLGGVAAARMRCFVEMEPNPEDRITLGTARDRYGMLLPKVSHRVSPLALASVDRLIETIAREFEGQGFAAVHRDEKPLADILTVDASHHLGGARMGQDPATSVVDPSLRLHASDNLYVAGGAVFPTGGCANPTLTIIGLSIRLADALKARLKVRPVAEPQSSVGAGILVVGAGRRVAEDVVPAVEALRGRGQFSGLLATSRKVVFGLDAAHEVYPLDTVDAGMVAASRLLYVAVPPAQLKGVLKRFRQIDCSHLVLVVDTPAIPASAVDDLYGLFQRVVIAEDSVYLPWLELFPLSRRTLAGVEFDRSAYRYHAVSLGRALAAGGSPVRPKIQAIRGKRNDVTITYGNGFAARIIGPRNYEEGSMVFRSSTGETISCRANDTSALAIAPIIEGQGCTGFRLGESEIRLSPVETRILGRYTADDTISSRMLDLKRVGLHRLLDKALQGEDCYTLDEALEDTRPKW